MFVDTTSTTIPPLLARFHATIAEETDAHGYRTYQTPVGTLASVTTIMKATEVLSPELEAWKARQTDHDLAEVEALRDDGAKRGNMVHDWIERYLIGAQTGVPRAERVQSGPWWDAIYPALRKIDWLHAAELPVFSAAMGCAGRLDCLATWQGTPVVIDWKTARRRDDGRRKPRAWLVHHHEQIAAYVRALGELGVLVNGQPVREGVLVVAVEGSNRPTIHLLDEGEVVQAADRFAARADRFYGLAA